MKTCAILAEYNPFHLGHAWQLQQARKKLGQNTAIIVVMSGCLTQRGEPALFDKWTRTRMALASGASLVIELPVAYAVSSAERFAEGGIQTIAATGLDCHLLFGSESGQLEPLEETAALLGTETDAFKTVLHDRLSDGLSFPAARQSALAETSGRQDLANLLALPNNILAVEYLKALNKIGRTGIKPITLPRQGQAYLDDTHLSDPAVFSSASAIRKRIWQFRQSGNLAWLGLFEDLQAMMPKQALAILLESLQAGPGPLFADDFAMPAISTLRSLSPEELDLLPGMGEGLGRRLAAAAAKPSDAASRPRFDQLIEDASTRRFPRTRIQRALINMLLGTKQADLDDFDRSGVKYLRILGFDRNGRHLLKIMRKRAQSPIFMNASDSLEHNDVVLRRMASLDSVGVDLWMLAAGQTCGRDFDTPAVMR